jgi:hypothetical protein
MLRGFILVTALVLAASMLWGTPVSAHPMAEVRAALELQAELPVPTTSPSLLWSAAPAPPSVSWPIVLAVVAVSIATWRRPRRALALAIVLVLGLFAFENGVHSVHHLNDLRHLDDLRSGATCTVAAATAQLSGTPVHYAIEAQLIPASPERLVLQQSLSFDASDLAAHQGRAPPVSA